MQKQKMRPTGGDGVTEQVTSKARPSLDRGAAPMVDETQRKKEELQKALSRLYEYQKNRVMKTFSSVLRKNYHPIVSPKDEGEKRFLPKQRLQALVDGVCPTNTKLAEGSADALEDIAEHFIAEAIQYAIAMAKKKKSRLIDAQDIGTYYSMVWNVEIPGYSKKIKQYVYAQALNHEKMRKAAARKENFADGQKLKQVQMAKATKINKTIS